MNDYVINGQKYLITTDKYFFGRDGKQYRAAWGVTSIFPDSVLGIKTNRNSSNWYCKVGVENNYVIIAGCQIHYAVLCHTRPNDTEMSTWEFHEGKAVISSIPCQIYFAE